MVELVKRLQLDLATEDKSLDPPGQDLEDLIVNVDARWDCKNVVQLLESALLCLGYPEEDHDQGGHIQSAG